MLLLCLFTIIITLIRFANIHLFLVKWAFYAKKYRQNAGCHLQHSIFQYNT